MKTSILFKLLILLILTSTLSGCLVFERRGVGYSNGNDHGGSHGKSRGEGHNRH